MVKGEAMKARRLDAKKGGNYQLITRGQGG
jgi:hypothetical protein